MKRPEKGEWVNQFEYTKIPIRFEKRRGLLMFFRKYQIVINKVLLKSHRPVFNYNGILLAWGAELESDNGSIPPDTQCIAGDRSAYEPAFYMHDWGWENKGLMEVIDWDIYVEDPTRLSNLRFIELQRIDMDRVLRAACKGLGASSYAAQKIFIGVRIGDITGLAKSFT